MSGETVSPGEGPAEAPVAWHHRLSVRVRVLSSVLIMCALGLAVSGGVANAIQNSRTLEQVDAASAQEVEEFRNLATQGVDPDSGEPFTSVEQLLLVALSRNVPSEHEKFLSFLDDKPHAYTPGGPPELVKSPEISTAVAAVPNSSNRVVTTDVTTSIGAVRLTVVPVRLDGSDVVGKFAIAFAVDRELGRQRDLMRTYALVALGALLLIGLVGWLVAGRLLRPLRDLRETTQRIGESDLTQRVVVPGSDDISELAQTFNDMLDRLEAAFGTQRQFLDDAGHELKTPLTIVRGHLELMNPDDPRDVEETRALLLDELDRMARLTQDLILLSKADRADFVRFAPMPLGPFTDEVLHKAVALGDRRWRVEARSEATVLADEQRLSQAVLQLADNAVKFSEPGTTIGIGTDVRGDQARVWVRDEGAGVRPADTERIFERFARGSDGNRAEGSGLGLAIVRAIAEAHHGTVEVARQPSGGSVFTMTLPTRHEEADPSGVGVPNDIEADA
ncbi:HAMP domain-containing sensor histidine kinase [Intrasporangium sp.]|uniref:sensor histidine kinase n=1 Tax=Intrasporangium sp. TaxID=1925024 RepID=UPI00293A1CB0|nr:HAMP domain-containing sensor histidine kinase [Intrasporangium sp.]MDV3221851.1 HAMP domain-containing histidine kinase [Intrasporangium sp.]